MYILHLHNIRRKYSEVLVTDNIDKFKPFPICKGLSFYHNNKRGAPGHSYLDLHYNFKCGTNNTGQFSPGYSIVSGIKTQLFVLSCDY